MRPRSLALLILVLMVSVVAIACQDGDAKETEGTATSTETDSADTAASAGPNPTGVGEADADSLAAVADTTEAREGRSWKDRLFGGGDDDDEDEEEVPTVPVEIASVAPRNMPAFLSSTASLEPEKQADILAKIDGEILRIQTEEGEWVREGQVLAELDGTAQRVALEEVAARAEGLRLNYERMQSLFDRELASEKDRINAKTDWEQAEAARKAAELNVVYTKIRAPYAGLISRRQVDPGQHVVAATHLYTIVDSDPLLARIHLPEREVVRLEPGQEVLISPDTDESINLTGSVLRIAPIVDSRTGTVKVTCQVTEKADALRPGSFVRVKVQTGLHQDVRAIPKRALLPEGGETFVYKAEADSVVKVRVETGYSDDEFVEIVEGLEDGDRVVTVGHGGLKTGTRFRDLTQPLDDEGEPSAEAAAGPAGDQVDGSGSMETDGDTAADSTGAGTDTARNVKP